MTIGCSRNSVVSAKKPEGVLDRREAMPKLVGDPNDFLIIAGLAGAALDIIQICEPNVNYYACGGAMGCATMMGLGLALAQPERRVLVATGDGDLLMNLGSLATVAVMNPPNLSIICVDNGRYWETGAQMTHTVFGVDLAAIAAGAGIPEVRTVSQESEIAEASSLIRQETVLSFILLRVKPTDPPRVYKLLDAAYTKYRFRNAVLGVG
jgi:phosphonopyruvate decarboxylase